MKAMPARILTWFALLSLAGASWFCQRTGKTVATAETPAPSPAAEMIVAGLGGFRGIAAEVVWFRAECLRNQGRYAELAQLATWLTYLEPHTSEVWSYTAWNLAYNISVTMPTPADRWRWVDAGIRLLRDDGLRLNPGDASIYKELSWMFLQKIGGHLDSASPYYRQEWRKRVEAASAEGTLAKLGLEPARMAAVDAEYGKQDWGSALASALYWGVRGYELAKKPEQRAELHQLIYQTLMYEARVDARFAPRALQEMRAAYAENPSSLLEGMIEAFSRNFGLK